VLLRDAIRAAPLLGGSVALVEEGAARIGVDRLVHERGLAGFA
jgi:hypothetical protein